MWENVLNISILHFLTDCTPKICLEGNYVKQAYSLYLDLVTTLYTYNWAGYKNGVFKSYWVDRD